MMEFLLLVVHAALAIWLCYRLLVIPAVYTRMGLREGSSLTRAWFRNLIELVWFPLIVLLAVCLWWFL